MKEIAIEHTGVIVVDLQGDFTRLHNGALAVEGTGRSYVEAVSDKVKSLHGMGLKIFATQDFHPEDHMSFYTRHPGKASFDVIRVAGRSQVLWPPHCVQGARNADLLLDESLLTAVVRKGTDKDYDSYSGFKDDGGAPTALDGILKRHSIQRLVIFGLAVDYCVRATALDAAGLGYETLVLTRFCRSVAPETGRSALDEMEAARVVLTADWAPGDG